MIIALISITINYPKNSTRPVFEPRMRRDGRIINCGLKNHVIPAKAVVK